MGGIVGRFFKEFALTLAFAVTASMFVALTLEPMLASRFLKPGGEKLPVFKAFEFLMRRATALYRRNLAWLLEHRYVVIGLALLALFVGGVFFAMLGKEFVTLEDKNQFIVRLETPLSYSIYKTDDIVRRVEKILQGIPEVINYFPVTGYSGSAASEANKAMIFVTLSPKKERKKSQLQIMSEVRNKVKIIPDLRAVVSEVSILGSGSRSEDVQFVIQGPSLEGLDRYSREIMSRLEDTTGFVDLDRDLELEKPEVRVVIDRNKAADLGVSVRTIAQTVGALIGGVDVVEYKTGGENYDVRLRLTDAERRTPADIDRIWVHTRKGEILDLASFVTIETGLGPSVINRLDRQRSVSIFSNLEGMPLADAQKEIDRITAEVLPEAYTTKYIGKSEAFQETVGYVIFAFSLAVIFTYLVLAAQFESFVYPFSIMMGLPLSFVGAFGLLYFTGNTFNLFSMLAMILLVGLPTKNGILLIDLTNQLRRGGMGMKQALVQASGTRLRPILMTAISTIAGVIPVALGIGVGAESRQCLAVAITGGMFSSTLLTLLVVPIIYSYLDGFTRLRIFGRLKKRIWVEQDLNGKELTPHH
jgi:HAE1 family hydrophobic/amphiphilic exporter-1